MTDKTEGFVYNTEDINILESEKTKAGRKPMDEESKKSELIPLRITKKEYELLEREYSKNKSLYGTLTGYVRHQLLTSINSN